MGKVSEGDGGSGSAEDGPGVCAEVADEGGFGSVAVGVAEMVEARGVVHLGEVGELVADDVVAETLGEEDEKRREGDDASGAACAEDAASARDAPSVDGEGVLGGDGAGAGEDVAFGEACG